MKKILLLTYCLLALSAAALAQRTIKGAVMDSKSEPVVGASVAVKGTAIGTLTGADGMYTLALPASVGKNAVVVFSLLGYAATEETIGDRTTINARLLEDEQNLEDVVVVAFGQQKKESVIGSITTISPKSLKVPSSNLTSAFQGRMAGMISYQTSGEPGADNSNFFIRGITTFGDGRADPLILIDNIELDATDLARLNPDDIESFSILKDATATSLYGSRGANGIILVKTKSGAKGKTQLSVRVENSFSMPTQEIKLADPITYMKLHNEAVLTRDPLRAEIYSQEKIDNTLQPGSNPYIYPATSWHDEMLESYAVTQRASVNVSGGGEIATYFVSGSWAIDRGNFKVDEMNNFNNNINLQKIGIRANVDIKLTSSTNLKVLTSASFDDYVGPPLASVNSTNTGGSRMYEMVMHANPVLFPASYPKPEELSYVNHTLFGNSDVDGFIYLNPYAELVRGYKEYSRSNMLASIELRQNLDFLTEGLSAKAMFNTSRMAYYSLQRTFNPFYYTLASWNKYDDTYSLRPLNPTTGTEYLGFDYGGSNGSLKFNTYMEGSMTYSRDFGDHGVSGLLVGTLRNILNPYRATSAGTVDLQSSLPERNISLSGRFTYAYASRYFGEFNFGYNGSERFSENHRFGFFPSAGLGWMISNERFFEPLKSVFTNLKLRYSYGLIGNDQIGGARFLYLSNVNFNGSALYFGDTYSERYNNATVTISRYANDQITWETSQKSNYAVELGLYGFDIVAEYYTERREGILLPRTNIPSTMGLWTEVYANLGKAQAKGVDISLDYSKVFNADFWVQARATFTYAHSEYIKYADYDYQNEPWLYHTGYPIRQAWGYIAEGLFVDDADVANSPLQFSPYMAGDIKYRDLNGDGQITTLDQAPIGYPTSPEINYGFGPSFGFYGFDLSFFFSGVARTSFFINHVTMSPFVDVGINSTSGVYYRGNNALPQFIVDSYWSENNKNSYAVWPRLSTEIVNNNIYNNTWMMRDGAFLRLKQVEFGYNIPQKIAARVGMTAARIYVSGTNLLVFSKFKLWDPELRTPSTYYSNGTSYPLQRVINLGVNLSF
ncbi:MAG: TonB-dependent receptor [Prevotellaceae bacterium]|jgi:TonB-linked SusC/RagA family outer membrane protein|nr:TonB-dependent receptor [Prevotellaceae bacterium]